MAMVNGQVADGKPLMADFKKSTVREYFESIVIAVILALFLLAVGATQAWATIKRRDIIVFKYPEEPERDFIKRVIGLPGETVEVRDKKVYVNGTALDEPYVHFLAPPSGPSEFHEVTSFDVRERYGPVTVPPDHYFVMGDNRDNSQDSRYWGFLPRELVKGKSLIIYWSYQAEREDYQDESASATVKGLVSVFAHFFTRTRWDRMFHQTR